MSFDGAFSRRGGASEAGRKALTDESVELNPQLRDLRAALGIAFGKGVHSGFGTPIGIEHTLTHALGGSC